MQFPSHLARQVFILTECIETSYLCGVLKPVVVEGTTELHDSVKLEIDGQPTVLPKDLKTLVVLNFRSYQAGLGTFIPLACIYSDSSI